MVDRNYFDHVILNCGGRYVFDVMTDLHIYYQEAGENIGWTTASDATSAQDIETRFMNSPEHRANILNANFTQIGIGAAPGTSADTCCDGSAMTMYTQIFLEPPAAPTPRPQPSHSTQPVAGASALPSVPRRNSPVPAVQISPATQPSPNVPVPSPSPSPSPTPGIELQGPAQGVTGTAQNAGLVELIVENVLRAFLNL
jgi:hypothetical protein